MARHRRSALASIAAGSVGGSVLHALRELFHGGLVPFCAGHMLCKSRPGVQDHLGRRSQAGGQEADDDHKSRNPASSRSRNQHSARSDAQGYAASTSAEPGAAGSEGANPCEAYACSCCERRIGAVRCCHSFTESRSTAVAPGGGDRCQGRSTRPAPSRMRAALGDAPGTAAPRTRH